MPQTIIKKWFRKWKDALNFGRNRSFFQMLCNLAEWGLNGVCLVLSPGASLGVRVKDSLVPPALGASSRE